ncbi:MAG: signal peptidase II [Maricaulaceae bacterium]
MAAEGTSDMPGGKLEAVSRWPVIGYVLAASVIVFDQLTKWIIIGPLNFSPPGCLEFNQGCDRIEVSPIVDLSMVWNRGVSYGLFQAESAVGRWGLVIFSAAVAVALGIWLRRTHRPFGAIALGLVIGGALGNMIDRARFGAVVDFIDFSGPWFGWTIGAWNVGFPWVFNIADASISIGAVLLLAEVLFGRKDEAASS